MQVRLHLRMGRSPSAPYRSGNRVISVGYSLLVHAGVVALLFSVPRYSEPDRPLYNSVIVPLETQHKITYYSFRKELPAVSPTNPDSAETKPDQSRLKSPQTIVTAPRAKPGKQFIFIPAPKVKLQSEVRAPNIIAFDPPAVPLPAKPKLKSFEAPQTKSPEHPAVTALDSAPKLADSPNDKLTTSVDDLMKPAAAPRRQFLMPAAANNASATRPAPVSGVPAPPTLQEGAQPASANLAIIGLNPVNTPQIPRPEGGRSESVMAGPTASNGPGQLGKGNSPINMPDVSIQGKPADSVAIATRTPPSAIPPPPGVAVPRMPAPVRAVETPHISVPQWPNNRTLPGPVEQHFRNRVVYMTVLPGAQVEADWIVWFGQEGTAPIDGRAVVRPPTLLQPLGLPPVPAREEHGTGKLRISGVIRKDGHLDSCSGLAGSTVNGELVAALQKWQFKPATWNGAAVDMDAVIEIPVTFATAKLQ